MFLRLRTRWWKPLAPNVILSIVFSRLAPISILAANLINRRRVRILIWKYNFMQCLLWYIWIGCLLGSIVSIMFELLCSSFTILSTLSREGRGTDHQSFGKSKRVWQMFQPLHVQNNSSNSRTSSGKSRWEKRRAEYRGTLMMIASPHVRAHDHGGGWSSVSHGDRDSSPRGVHADPLSPPDESIRAEQTANTARWASLS